MSDLHDKALSDRLRDAASGSIEWRVQDKDRAYCMAFSSRDTINPERAAREWFSEHSKNYPENAAKYEVARCVVLDRSDRLMIEAADTVAALLAENERLQAKLNTPETENFLQGVRFEVAHQVERWGTVHDRAKQPADWFWLVGYLSGKALAAHIAGDRDKALHHCISTAAVLANWHTHVLVGSGSFTPGSSDLQRFLTDTFGAEVPRG